MPENREHNCITGAPAPIDTMDPLTFPVHFACICTQIYVATSQASQTYTQTYTQASQTYTQASQMYTLVHTNYTTGIQRLTIDITIHQTPSFPLKLNTMHQLVLLRTECMQWKAWGQDYTYSKTYMQIFKCFCPMPCHPYIMVTLHRYHNSIPP